MDKKSQTVQTYDGTAHLMAKKFEAMGARIADIEQGFSFVETTGPFVLEIGCGNGREAEEILKRTSRYLGIDISKSFVGLAKERLPGADIRVADVEAFAFPKDLDIVFAFASLLHSDREALRMVLKQVRDALSANGIFYISLKRDDYCEELKTDEFGTRTFYYYQPEDIIILAGEGYGVVYQEFQNRLGQDWFTLVLKKR
ncbi:MAG: methyltransferase type 12 [Patescibacteria group bacterium]|jgi:SAM-dependent methyltransferase|nr:methyltransferase type 12 [Patescibacteria group bacterium]